MANFDTTEEKQLATLERIALALEAIAGLLEDLTQTTHGEKVLRVEN